MLGAVWVYDMAQETKNAGQQGQEFVFGLSFTVEYEERTDKVGEKMAGRVLVFSPVAYGPSGKPASRAVKRSLSH